MDQHQFTRRRFIVSVIALSGTAGAALRPDLFAVSRAWAESASPLDDSLRQAMLRMARLLFPHDALGDDVYAEILDRALSDVASGTEFAEQLEATADALARYFLAIQNQVRVGIYNGAAFWKHVGYPGPSKGFGGYLHRGAGDIDWLPEDE
jgi:hypothetical protein